MSTLTADQAHRIIRAALLDRADKCRKLATGHSMKGPVHANSRASIRQEAQWCLALAKRVEYISVLDLADLFGMAGGSGPAAERSGGAS